MDGRMEENQHAVVPTRVEMADFFVPMRRTDDIDVVEGANEP
jgi:hypothetical protein